MSAGTALPALLLSVACLVLLPAAPSALAGGVPGDGSQVVLLLHGHSRSSRSMQRIEDRLKEQGYTVRNIDYPSRTMDIGGLAERLGEELERCCAGEGLTVHFVTHSLGGIVVRYYLMTREMENLGRVVMLSPPNSGSELADLLNDIPVVNRHTSESRLQLGTDGRGVPRRLGPVDYELGIIAGDRSIVPVFSWIIPGPDDGMVSVESAKVEGMSDFIVVPHSHTFIMESPEVIDQILAFLRDGAFVRPPGGGAAPIRD